MRKRLLGFGGIGVRQVFLRVREAVVVVVAAAVQRAEVMRIGQFPGVRQAVAVGIVAPGMESVCTKAKALLKLIQPQFTLHTNLLSLPVRRWYCDLVRRG